MYSTSCSVKLKSVIESKAEADPGAGAAPAHPLQ